MADQLRRIPIHRALNRPDLMAGCERELFLGLSLTVAMLVFTAMTWVSTITAAVVWPVGIWALRTMAKADPVMSKVYLKHVRYKSYYPARSTPFAESANYKK